jgi:type IV secretory pathway VirB10-like protein
VAVALAVILGVALLFALSRRSKMQIMQRESQDTNSPRPATDARKALEDKWSKSDKPAGAVGVQPPPLAIQPNVQQQVQEPEEEPLTPAELLAQQEEAARASAIVPKRADQPNVSANTSMMPQSGLPGGSTPPTLDQIKKYIQGVSDPQSSANIGQLAPPAQNQYEEQNGLQDKKAFAGPEAKFVPILVPKERVDEKCTVRAGWDIPAVLEQSAVTDLPGEIRARVALGVYDTDHGKCLAIPQNSILIGRYNSNVTYAQERVQVRWTRLIMRDTHQAINLDGMNGQDAEGSSGLTGKVDHHYKRLIGFAALSSAIAAGVQLTQNRSYNNGYPSNGQLMAQSAGSEFGNIGRDLALMNNRRQPTIKLMAGTNFTVRVDRDMVFEQ